MTTKYYHGVMNDVDDDGNIRVLYPKTFIGDIIMDDGQSLSDHLTAEDNTEFNFSKNNGKYGFMDSEGHFIPFKTVQASKTVTASTSAITVTPDDGNDGIANITVNPTPSETKSQAAGTSNIDVIPTSGKLLSKVTITPQQHGETYTASSRSSALDMGIQHAYRFINTLGIPLPPVAYVSAYRETSSASSSWPTDVVLSGKKYYVVHVTKDDATAFCNTDSLGTSTVLTDNTINGIRITTWLLETKATQLHMNYMTNDGTFKEGLWTYIVFGPID